MGYLGRAIRVRSFAKRHRRPIYVEIHRPCEAEPSLPRVVAGCLLVLVPPKRGTDVREGPVLPSAQTPQRSSLGETRSTVTLGRSSSALQKTAATISSRSVCALGLGGTVPELDRPRRLWRRLKGTRVSMVAQRPRMGSAARWGRDC